MKRLFSFLIASVLMLAASSAMALQEVPLASASRVTTTVSSDMYLRQGANGSPADVGIQAQISITNVSTVTVTFSIEGKSALGTYYPVLSSTSLAATTATYNMVVRPGITAVSNYAVSAPMPPVFRIKATHSNGTGSMTYSVSVDRTP